MSDPVPFVDQNAPNLGNQFIPGLAGAANSLLFGLPEAAIKGIGGDKVRQIVEQYKAQNPGYGVGDVAGTVGSALIPGAGLLGLGAKAAGKLGARAAESTLTKGAEYLGTKGGTLGQMVGRGAAEAAVQAVPRGVAEAVNTGDPKQAAENASLGIGLGAGLGAVGKGLGKIGQAIGQTGVGKTVKDEVGKWFEDAILSSVDVSKPVLAKEMNESARRLGLNRVGYTFNNVDDVKAKTVDFVINKNLFNKINRENYLSDQSPLWQKAADDYNKAPVDFTDQKVIDIIRNDPAVVEYAKHSAVGQQGVDDMILDMIGNVDPYKTSFNNSKAFLTKEVARGRKAQDIRGEAKAAIADTMHDLIDDQALKLSPELADLRAEYPIIKLLKRASSMERLGIEAPATSGSETFPRLLSSAALGGVGAATVPDDQKLAALGAGIAAPFVARAGGKLVQQGLGNLAGKVIRAGESNAPLAMAERIQPTVGQTFNASAPSTPIPTMQPIPMPGQAATMPTDRSQSMIDQGLETAWSMEDPRGLIERTQPGAKQEFMQGVKQAITNEDGSINYYRAAKVLFPQNPEEQKRFADAYTTYNAVASHIDDAVKPFIFNDPAAESNKQTARAALIDHLKKVASYDEKTAVATVDGILNSMIRSAPKKIALINKLLKETDKVGFGDNGLLRRVGVLK